MPYNSTIGNDPGLLPHLYGTYRANVAAVVVHWFSEHLYVSSARKIELALQQAEIDAGETRPSQAAISSITQIIEQASKTKALSSEPDVSAFHGEAIVTWRCGRREISLLSRGHVDDPKLLSYEAGQNQPSDHRIVPNATGRHLEKAIGWLYA
jgi:hypothetical protein